MELRHPGIVGVHDFGVSDQGQPFIVMELVSGRTLSQLIASDTVLPLPDLIDMFKHLAEAIAYAHSKGVIHRDRERSEIPSGTRRCAGYRARERQRRPLCRHE